MYLTWASFNNIRMLLMAFMPIIIFYLIWLVNTSESIRSEEGTLLDLVCWPDGNAIPVLITCGAVVAVVIELYGLYQLFKAGLPRREYDVTNGLFYYIWALIIITIIFLAIMFYSGLQSTIIRAKIKGGITKAMLRYATHLPSKVAIDRLQTRFHCCGRVNYQEWFYIPWFTTEESVDSKALDGFTFTDEADDNSRLPRNGFIALGLKTSRLYVEGRAGKTCWTDNRKFVADNVPYSCCSMDALYPCIHHRVLKRGRIYKYDPSKQLTISKDGCEEKLIKEMMAVSLRFNVVMALLIVAMILQVITVRYLHTAYKSGLHVANQICCQAYLLRSSTDSEFFKTVHRTSLRRQQTRTQQWVSMRLKSDRRRYTATSGSEPDSSDELLKPIDE